MPYTEEELQSIMELKRFHQTGAVSELPTSTVDIERPRREPKGTLMKTLDYLIRPLYASAGFSKAIVENKPIEEAFRASIRGITGKERVFYSDVLKSAGVKNKYVRAIGGLALDIGLDPVTYLTFGAGAGAKLGLTTLNKGGIDLLNKTLTRQLPKLTERNLAITANRRIAEEIGRESIEEAVLRMALKEPEKYISQSAVRIFGKKISVVSDVFITSTKKITPIVGKIPGMRFVREKPMKWIGEAFIGDEYIIKHAKNLTPLQKNLLELHRQQTKARILLGGELAMEKSLQIAKEIPNFADREIIAHAIEQASKKFVTPTQEVFFVRDLVPEHLMGKADEISKFIFKEITEPEVRRGLLRTFREGYVPHYYKARMAGLLSKDIPHPIIARNRFGHVRIFDTLETAKNAGWQPIEDIAVSVGLRNAYSKRVLAIDDYVQKMLSTCATPLSKKSLEWKTMVKTGGVPEGMGIYIPRGGARFYPLYNSTKEKTIQITNEKAIQKLFQAEGTGGFFGGELLKELRLTPIQTAFKISDDIPVYLLPREIADMMNKFSPYFTREKGLHDIIRFSDSALNFWKASVTSWWPGFHSRNAMSNVWLAFLGGMTNPIDAMRKFYLAGRLQYFDYLTRRGKPAKDFITRLGGKNYRASELVRQGKETGVLYRGWFGAELGRTTEQEIMLRTGIRPRLTGKQKGIETARDIILEKPRAVGTAVENNSRFALFLDQLDKGIDTMSAARHTKKFLFDYGELTQFEKSWMKRLFPFYTWVRKNIPLEVEMLFRQPGKFALIKKTQEEFESLSERPDERFLPDWMRERELYVRLPGERDKPLYMNFDFAFQDLARLTLSKSGWELLREAYGYLRPDIKALPEILTNYNVYFGRNIADPNLPQDVKFRKGIKEEILGALRIAGYMRRFSKEDVATIPKILDFALGLKPYPYDEAKQRYWYYRRKELERKALEREERKRKKMKWYEEILY